MKKLFGILGITLLLMALLITSCKNDETVAPEASESGQTYKLFVVRFHNRI